MYKGLQQIAESQKGCRSINPDAGLPCCIGSRCWELFFDPVPSLHLQLRMSNLLFERLRADLKDKRYYKFILVRFTMANIKNELSKHATLLFRDTNSRVQNITAQTGVKLIYFQTCVPNFFRLRSLRNNLISHLL